MADRYLVNEMFASLQGEGLRAGTAAVFLRFAKCNLSCSKATGEGFDCDTDFERGEWMTAREIANAVGFPPADGWIIATGGEPSLQLDDTLVSSLQWDGWKIAIETNGTRPLPADLDWICCSPKSGHPVVLDQADEWKFVMGPDSPLPDVPGPGALLLSPRFDGDEIDRAALAHCIDLIQANPTWRLSVQQHKFWQVR